jgi:hypothetical protein
MIDSVSTKGADMEQINGIPISIVGGGLAGLVAAISVAEQGGRAVLHESSTRLGGRARSAQGSYCTNFGPHALYRHGDLEAWLCERDLLPEVGFPSLTGLRLRRDGRLSRLPLALLPMMRSAGADAPADRSYREWATERMGARAAEAAIGFAALPTFHADPGSLSAAFVQERIARSLKWRPVYYVRGGWGRLVSGLAGRAEELGVEIKLGSKLRELPSGPVIVATDLSTAARLLHAPELDWPRARTALFDVALRSQRGDPAAVLDVDERMYASVYSAGDASLAPPGEMLVQASAGLRAGEGREDTWLRMENILADSFADFRARVTWQRRAISEAGAGPADPPGSSWRDRPAIERGGGRWLVGDCVAAPGVLSEVSVASARIAAEAALAHSRAPLAAVAPQDVGFGREAESAVRVSCP